MKQTKAYLPEFFHLRSKMMRYAKNFLGRRLLVRVLISASFMVFFVSGITVWLNDRSHLSTYVAVQALSIVLFSLFLFVLFERIVTRHLRRLADHLSAEGTVVSPVDLGIDRNGVHGDELDELVSSINHMRRRLAASFEDIRNAEGKLTAQEHYHRAVVDNSLDVVTVLKHDGSILFNSPSILFETGFLADELMGTSAFDRVHPDDIPSARAAIGAVLDDPGLTRTIEFRYRHKNGEWQTFEGKVRRLSEDSVVFNSRNIMDRKRIEQALRESEERYRSLFWNNHAVMLILEPATGQIVDANPAAARFYGYDIDQLHRKNINQINTLDPDKVHAHMERAVREEHNHFLFNHRLANGDVRPVEVYSGPIQMQGNRFLFSIVHDISARRKAEEEAQALQAELEKRVQERTRELTLINNELESFCYSVSHDLRGPLRHMQGYSSILLNEYADHLDDDARHCLNRLGTSVLRLGQLVDDLLDLSRVSRCELKRERVNLSEVVRDAAIEYQRELSGRRIEVCISHGLFATADPHLIRIAVNNLIANAFKYTSKVEHAVIEFKVTDGEGDQAFLLKDNGAGFDMTYASKLFQPFQRLHAPGEFEGTGIGLATVSRIIQRHGGKIWADGRVGEGASFFFTLGTA